MVTEFPWEVLFHSLWLSDHGICKFLCEDCIFIQSYAWTHMHTHVHTHTFRWTHSHSYPYSHIDTHTDSHCHTIALISHAAKVILKIPQARLQQYVNCERSDVQAGFRKGRGNRDQVANVRWIIEKAREFQKNIYLLFKAFDCVDHTNFGKFFKRWRYQTTKPASWEIRMWVKKQQLELDMEKQSFQIGKGICQDCILYPTYLIYM